MKLLFFAVTLLTAVTTVTRGATVFVLPNSARATNLTLVGGSATGFTNTGGTYTNPTITGGLTTGGTNTTGIFTNPTTTGGTVTGGTNTTGVFTNPTTTGGTVTGGTNTTGVFTNPTATGGTVTGGTNVSGLFSASTLAGATVSLVTNTDLTASRVLVSDAAKRVTNSVTTATELGYVSGVTSAIQTQLGTKAPTASPTFTGIVTLTNLANGLGLVGTPSYTFTGDENTGLWSSGADTINFSTGGSERARFDSTGRLQIGGSTGDQLVSINSLAGNAMVSYLLASSTKVFTGISANNDTPVVGMTTGDYGIRVQGNDIFLSADSGASGNLVIKNSGNVGIGTATPSYLLDVNGIFQSRGTSGGVRQYTGSATNQNRMIGVLQTVTTTVANVGTAETNLMTSTFPASGLAATGDTVEVLAFGTTAANANSKIVAAYFGSTKIVQSAAFTNSAAAWRIVGTVTRTGATNQVACVTVFVDSVTPVTTYTAPTETLSGTITIKATGTGAADSDITQVFHRSEFKPGNP